MNLSLRFFSVLLPCRSSFPASGALLAFQGGLLSSIFHSFRPDHDFGPVSHLYDCFSGNQVKVVHFMAVGTKNDKVLRIVVFPLAIKMRHFQHGKNAEATMGAKWPVNFEGQLAIINLLFHWFYLMPLLFLLTPNIHFYLYSAF